MKKTKNVLAEQFDKHEKDPREIYEQVAALDDRVEVLEIPHKRTHKGYSPSDVCGIGKKNRDIKRMCLCGKPVTEELQKEIDREFEEAQRSGVIPMMISQDTLKRKIGLLRQWLNELPEGSPLITNKDLEVWLL